MRGSKSTAKLPVEFVSKHIASFYKISKLSSVLLFRTSRPSRLFKDGWQTRIWWLSFESIVNNIEISSFPAKIDLDNELVRHFLIEPSKKGVRLKGSNEEPAFPSLVALIYQHSLTRMALPITLTIPYRGRASFFILSHSIYHSYKSNLRATKLWDYFTIVQAKPCLFNPVSQLLKHKSTLCSLISHTGLSHPVLNNSPCKSCHQFLFLKNLKDKKKIMKIA